jgi:Zn-dependent M28 family amino/carboxypeptidase
MNKLTLPLMALVMLFTAGCATSGIMTGESYTDEGSGTQKVEAKTSTQSDPSDLSVALPDIAAYDEPEITPLDTSMNDNDITINGVTEATDLPEIATGDDPEIPVLDAPATE